MKIFNRLLKAELYTSAIEVIKENAQDSFRIKNGQKIARIERISPYFNIIVEMQKDGDVIADYNNRVAIVVEGNNIVNIHNHVFKITDDDDYRELRSLIEIDADKWNDDAAVDEIIDGMIKANVIAVNGG